MSRVKVFERVGGGPLREPPQVDAVDVRQKVHTLLLQHDAATFHTGNTLEGREARSYRRALLEVLRLLDR